MDNSSSIRSLGRQFLLSLAGLLVATPLHAGSWQCRNSVEVQCEAQTCSATPEGGFTPMQVDFDSTGKFSVCAYSGCWEGRGGVSINWPFMIVSKPGANWSDPSRKTENRQDILIAYNATDNIALVKAGALALPLHCHRRGNHD